MQILALSALLAFAVAQSSVSQAASITSASSQSIATRTSSGVFTHTVAVAKAGHKFSPDVTLASVGDVIEFQFYPTNHSVIRADYGYPCVPYEMVLGAGYHGFFSGFQPVDAILDNPPSWNLTVNDTEPIFFYCGAPNSCIGYGMVGVINPNASTSLAKQQQLAEASSFMLLPGEDWPSEGSIPSGVASSSTSSTSPTAATSAPTVTQTTVAAAASHGLGAGAIAGIAIGGAAVLLGAFVAIWFCGRQSRKGQQVQPAAPAQEVHHGYNSAVGSVYGKPGHMSMVSGYAMPPGYEPHGMQSPQQSQTPVDPAMYQMNGPSPHLRSVSPQYPVNQMPNM